METQHLLDDFRRTVDEATTKLQTVSEGESSERLGPERWTRKELLGHLIDSAANNHQRFIRGQLSHSLKSPGYEQERWVECNGYIDRPWTDLVELWRAYNIHLQHVIARIPLEKFATPCVIGDSDPVTLGFVAEDYVRHLKHHLQQLFA